MQYRRVGKWGLKLPEISLGLGHNFGGTAPLERSREIVRPAFELGITHFDLANNYGPPYGSAEEMFGQILGKDLAGHRDEIVVSTKAGWDMWPVRARTATAPHLHACPAEVALLDRADVGAVDREPLHQRNFVCGSPSAGRPNAHSNLYVHHSTVDASVGHERASQPNTAPHERLRTAPVIAPAESEAA
jgi:hypothetical protein